MVLPPRPAHRPQRHTIPRHYITGGYANARVQANQRYNDEVRRYNVLLFDMPMDRRNVFLLPVDCWSGREPVPGLPKKMAAIRQVVPAQWLAWARPMNLAIQATDTQQQMIDRYLMWLGIPPLSNLWDYD
jgi:hypothetical protein